MAESQHLGAERGIGLAADDQDLKQEADRDVDEGVEHDRGASQRHRSAHQLDLPSVPETR
jgi:hypothetical protein